MALLGAVVVCCLLCVGIALLCAVRYLFLCVVCKMLLLVVVRCLRSVVVKCCVLFGAVCWFAGVRCGFAVVCRVLLCRCCLFRCWSSLLVGGVRDDCWLLFVVGCCCLLSVVVED